MLASPAMQSDNEFHILADGVLVVPSGFDHRLAMENRKCTRNDEGCAHEVPPCPPEKEGPQVLHHLEAFEHARRHLHTSDVVVTNLAPVQDANDAAARHSVDWRSDDRAHEPEESVALK